MKIKFYKYNSQDAEIVTFHLKSHGIKCDIIGGIRDKGHSNKDIDLYFPELDGEEKSVILLAELLGCSTKVITPAFVRTDVGGIYFYSKIFGEIDCFFKKHTKEYCENFWKENPDAN